MGSPKVEELPEIILACPLSEGARINPAKLLAAQEYAASQGLPSPRNVLIPRTKVFILPLPNDIFHFKKNTK